MLHGHGDDRSQYTQTIRADFSTNVWYGGEPKGLKDYLFSQWDSINRYPEVLAESLARQIADHHHVKPNQVLVNSGTTESIYLLAQAFVGRTTTIIIPAFAEYEDACRMHHHALRFLNWDELAGLPDVGSELVFICNPNNPTGAVFNKLATWITQNPTTLFVLDEAFIDFTDQLNSAIPLLSQLENLIILRSLTKAYAIPGLRLGYVISSSICIDKLKAIKPPWTVNTMALAAGRFIFDRYDQIQLPLGQLLADKTAFIATLQQNPIIQLSESATHFFLARTKRGTAAQLKAFLIDNHGLLIRDASNFRGLEAGHFRVCTLSPEKNNLFINALAEWNR